MVYLNNKTSYKLSHTLPRNWATLRDSLVVLLWGVVLLVNKTITMKKTIGFLVAVLVLVPMVSFASFDVSLKYGSRGEAVSELQDFLNDQGTYTGKIDGKFGLGTLKAVKAWQRANNLTVDGYFGRMSRAKANDTLAQILSDSNATELAETGIISFPSLSPIEGCTSVVGYSVTTGRKCDGSVPMVVQVLPQQSIPNVPAQEVIQPKIPSPTINPIEVPFSELGGKWNFIFVSRFERSDALTLFVNNVYNGDIVTITFNGQTTTNTFTGGDIGEPLLYGSYQFPETIGLNPETEYPYILKVQRGDKYSVRTGVFKTLKDYN